MVQVSHDATENSSPQCRRRDGNASAIFSREASRGSRVTHPQDSHRIKKAQVRIMKLRLL